jgi:hypothetical protein
VCGRVETIDHESLHEQCYRLMIECVATISNNSALNKNYADLLRPTSARMCCWSGEGGLVTPEAETLHATMKHAGYRRIYG